MTFAFKQNLRNEHRFTGKRFAPETGSGFISPTTLFPLSVSTRTKLDSIACQRQRNILHHISHPLARSITQPAKRENHSGENGQEKLTSARRGWFFIMKRSFIIQVIIKIVCILWLQCSWRGSSILQNHNDVLRVQLAYLRSLMTFKHVYIKIFNYSQISPLVVSSHSFVL